MDESTPPRRGSAAPVIAAILAAALVGAIVYIATLRGQLTATQQQLTKAKEAAQPRDIVDIVVCEPFTIRVKPVEKK